ncbi:MAG: hypothetical protein NTY53_12225, partial [Kiritimatiellaeota bacterium]|nr:hypothetical protein [Kiritimatiellota bacterium]
VAAQVRALEPWLWMDEADIFGVQDTQSSQVLFVSVMGMLGEHYAVAVYPGASELARQQHLANSLKDLQPDLFFDMRHAQVAFDKKSALYPEEKEMVKQLGVVHKGGHAWPSFQSLRPGYFPWLADAEEARWLLLAMEQLLIMAPRIEQDPAVLSSSTEDDAILIRLPDAAAPGGWREEFRLCAPPTHRLQPHVPPEALGTVRFLPQQELHIEVDVFPMTTPIGEQGERPQLPYALILVDPASLFVLGFEILTVPSSLEEMWLDVPAKLLKVLAKSGLRPATITVQRAWLDSVLQTVCADLGIALRSGPLTSLPPIRQEMEAMMNGRA